MRKRFLLPCHCNESGAGTYGIYWGGYWYRGTPEKFLIFYSHNETVGCKKCGKVYTIDSLLEGMTDDTSDKTELLFEKLVIAFQKQGGFI